jgi:hypothetical protein
LSSLQIKVNFVSDIAQELRIVSRQCSPPRTSMCSIINLKRLIFLVRVYKAHSKEEPKSASDIGRAWFACYESNLDEPESELAQEFERLS